MSRFRKKREDGTLGWHPLHDHEADALGLPRGSAVAPGSDDWGRLIALPQDGPDARAIAQAEWDKVGEYLTNYMVEGNDDSLGLMLAQPWPVGVGDRLRYDKSRREPWHVWREGLYWVPDHMSQRHELVRSRIRVYMSVGASTFNEDILKAVGKYMNVNARKHLLEDLSTRTPIVVPQDHFDQKRHLLGVANGVVDLDTGEHRPGRPEDRITMNTRVKFNEDAQCPRFMRFLQEVTSNGVDEAGNLIVDPELWNFLALYLGYMVAGENHEERWAQWTGDGGNGKGKLKQALLDTLGDYAIEVAPTMFMKTRSGPNNASAPDPTILDMRNRRVVFSSEPEGEGQRLNELRVKQVSGHDTASARYLYSNDLVRYEYDQNLVILTNQTLELEDPDPAQRRRLIVFPFDIQFGGTEREDPYLDEALQAEAEGILRFLVTLAVEYRQGEHGKVALRPMPKRAQSATTEYFDKNNPLGPWKVERVITDLGGVTATADLWADYEAWFKVRSGPLGLMLADKVTYGTFVRRVGQLGLKKKDTKHAKGYECRLREEDPGQTATATGGEGAIEEVARA